MNSPLIVATADDHFTASCKSLGIGVCALCVLSSSLARLKIKMVCILFGSLYFMQQKCLTTFGYCEKCYRVYSSLHISVQGHRRHMPGVSWSFSSVLGSWCCKSQVSFSGSQLPWQYHFTSRISSFRCIVYCCVRSRELAAMVAL